jgi:hypothetical protein
MSKEKLIAEYEAFQKKVAEQVKGLRQHFPPLFSKLFEKHSWVESFSWRQCEPWNDGEETEFEVMCDWDSIYINDENAWDNEAYKPDSEKHSVYKEFSAALEDLPTDLMKALFGESNEVEVKKSGEIFVTEYTDG